jgi:hypothetical protein
LANWRKAPKGSKKPYEVLIDGEWQLRNNPDGIALDVVTENNKKFLLYDPHPAQMKFHQSTAKNLLAHGSRGGGKSLMMRMEAHMRCLMIPNFHALILRRTMPELRTSHLVHIERECKLLGGVYLHTTFTAKYPNGSTISFRHCETEADILNFLSSEYGIIYFDELSTFTLDQFLQISASCRAPSTEPYDAVIRAGSNPLGVGAEWMESWFINHDVRLEDYPDYRAEQYQNMQIMLADNPSLDRKAYEATLRNLPKHIRDAWLDGKFVREGAYFDDYEPMKDLKDGRGPVPWHVISEIPTMKWHGQEWRLIDIPWVNIYRAIDWGYDPDPAVCLWIAVMPNKRSIVFKEMTWKRTIAEDVAKDIKRHSEGMKIAESFCDPVMFIKTGTTIYSIGEIFEANGVPLTPAANKRELFGYSVHSYLNNVIDGHPQVQIVGGACRDLVRTIPMLTRDKADPNKLADGPDHWTVALAYFCMGSIPPSREPGTSEIPRWMRKKSPTRVRTYA